MIVSLFSAPEVQRKVDTYRAYAERFAASGSLAELDATIFRAGSVRAREIVAAQASDGMLSSRKISDLAGIIAGEPNHALAEGWRRLHPHALIRLARMMGLQDMEANDRVAAYSIFRAIHRTFGPKLINRTQLKLFADLAYFLGEFGVAKELAARLPEAALERKQLEVDLANPWSASPYSDYSQWLDVFNTIIAQTGAPPVTLLPDAVELTGDDTPFGQLWVRGCEPGGVDGPLVTVVMSCWSPDRSLFTALMSLVRQTWRNIEILLIDDCSPPEYLPILEEAAQLDARIRLLRQDKNGGTYHIRNRGLAEARGEFFTVQDSDDWAHPERIQRQVEAILTRDACVASHCRGIRALDNLVMNYPGVAPHRVNESSLMFRTALVRNRIGYYHTSRKGADTEFSIRLRSAFGPTAYVEMKEILTAIRLSEGSLSRAEFKPGWRHPNRSAYRRNFETWHASASNGLTPYYHPIDVSCFQAPMAYRTGLTDGDWESHRKLQWLFVGDFRPRSGHHYRIIDTLHALVKAGEKVAILHLDSFLNPSRQAVEPLALEIVDLIEQGLVTEVVSTDGVHADEIVIASPDIVQFNDFIGQHAVRASHATILFNKQDLDGDLYGNYFSIADCENTLGRLTGVRPRWKALSATALDAMKTRLPRRHLSQLVWPSYIDIDVWTAPQRVWPSALPKGAQVLGRMTHAELIQVFSQWVNESLMFWVNDASQLVDDEVELPGNWQLQGAGQTSQMVFLAGIGEWLDPYPRGERTVLPILTLRALASGCRLILDNSWEDTIDAGNVRYREAGSVFETGAELGIAASLATHFDPDAHIGHLRAMRL